MPDTTRVYPRRVWRDGTLTKDTDRVVVEAPVALVYNGISHAVMMATPDYLEDLAMGFSLSEGILQQSDQLLDCELIVREKGLEVAMEITAQPFAALKQRRRNLAGRTGCGLCGVESLDQLLPVPKPVESAVRVSHGAIQAALVGLDSGQQLKILTGGVHGAAWCSPSGDILLVREDVGRHNALDKLLGAMAREQLDSNGFALVTSRASYEMVAKAAACGVPVLAAVSAPTDLAVEQALASGVSLVGFVQRGRQVIYTHGERIEGAGCA